jgi:ketosteroid isomerase-like protein
VTTNNQTQELAAIQHIFEALESRDIDAFAECFAENARYEMPFGESDAPSVA